MKLPNAGLDALVLDGATRQALAATRSLGRAGLRLAVAQAGSRAPGRLACPSFSSRWAETRMLLPDYADGADAFAKNVLDLVATTPVRAVLANTDESVASLRPWRAAIEPYAALALASEASLDIAVNKTETLRVAQELGIAVPRTTVVTSVHQVAAALADVGVPVVVKPAMSWARDYGGARLSCSAAVSVEEAEQAVARLSAVGMPALLQEWVGGRREGVGLFRANGRVVAEFAHVSYRTTPMLGGFCASRESIAMPDDLRNAAVTLVDSIGVEGYSQVEFRRDKIGRPVLMEINPRLTASMELAVRSGVNFPWMLWRWACGEPVEPVKSYRAGVRMRWLAGDVRWLMETLRHQGRPGAQPAVGALAVFLRDFARRTAYDYFDHADVMPAAVDLAHSALKMGRLFARRKQQLPSHKYTSATLTVTEERSCQTKVPT